jgi:hypothetical protein
MGQAALATSMSEKGDVVVLLAGDAGWQGS